MQIEGVVNSADLSEQFSRSLLSVIYSRSAHSQLSQACMHPFLPFFAD
jgi:hypothetical protein